MPDIIQLLPEHVANQIAAGEVVQRPASVVKELMENALDAGARSITVRIIDAGKTLIEITDNGRGMSPTDARLSFLRHATSKIRKAEDLFSISSMGFRGEALPSIGAVAQVFMKTRRAEDELSTELNFEAGEYGAQKLSTGPAGTCISVRNLFFNIPARRAFLKNNAIESRHIADEFQRQSLAHPDVFFSLSSEGREIYHLQPASLRQRIAHVFGSAYSERLIPVEESTDVLSITGFVGKPEFARKTRGEQFFFINGRYIREPYFHHALMKAYEELLPAESYPFYCLYLSISPERLDINVHPAKTEVKFEDDKLLYTIVRAAVKRALGRYIISPSIDFGAETGFSELGIFPVSEVFQPVIRVNQNYNPFLKPETNAARPAPDLQQGLQTDRQAPAFLSYEDFAADPEKWRGQYTLSEEPAELQTRLQPEQAEGEALQSGSRSAFQINLRYLVTTLKSGLLIIDQQAAHERILYESYLEIMEQHSASSQQTLFPQTISFNAADHALVRDLAAEIRLLGFELREFGPNSWVLEGIPAGLPPGNEQGIIEILIDNYKENHSLHKLEKRDNLARSLARKAGLKTGRKLEQQEINLLIDQLFACQSPSSSPSGKPVFVTVGTEEIQKKFEK